MENVEKRLDARQVALRLRIRNIINDMYPGGLTNDILRDLKLDDDVIAQLIIDFESSHKEIEHEVSLCRSARIISDFDDLTAGDLNNVAQKLKRACIAPKSSDMIVS